MEIPLSASKQELCQQRKSIKGMVSKSKLVVEDDGCDKGFTVRSCQAGVGFRVPLISISDQGICERKAHAYDSPLNCRTVGNWGVCSRNQ
jgi:hypothetical protein